LSSLYNQIISKPYRRLLQTGDSLRNDWINPACILLLSIIGVVFIYSAQFSTGGGAWKMQLIWVALGWVAYCTVASIDYKVWLTYAHWVYFAGIVGLLLVQTPIGVEMMGARRWINLQVLYFQPTEAAKIGTLIMAASLLARSKLGNVKESLSILVLLGLIFLLPMGLIFLQPDLGSTLVFPPMLFALLYVSRLSQRFFITTFAVFSLFIAVVAVDVSGYARHLQTVAEQPTSADRAALGAYQDRSWLPMRDYQRTRILTFVAPRLIDPSGTGASWNANQAKISAATGGLSGKGLLQGTQAQLGYLPKAVAHNDFIYSVIAEETGFIGSALVITLFGLMVANGIRIAALARDRFGMQLATGVSVLFLVHFFINIGMTVGITPITGLPLPFLSYGGSFVLSCFVLQGFIQSVYRHRSVYA
jgi:rod shape determining protein RodA